MCGLSASPVNAIGMSIGDQEVEKKEASEARTYKRGGDKSYKSAKVSKLEFVLK
jgi:hypothetical protein